MSTGTSERASTLAMIVGMIDLVPDGYYATQVEDTATVNFIRLSRPTRGQWKDTIKFQSQHSDKWKDQAVYSPAQDRWLMYPPPWFASAILLMIADHRGCSRRYAVELQHCGVCNTELTDDRSRHYLIGPVCDKKPSWTWVIPDVDDKNDGLSFEDLVARGLPTRVWQDR